TEELEKRIEIPYFCKPMERIILENIFEDRIVRIVGGKTSPHPILAFLNDRGHEWLLSRLNSMSSVISIGPHLYKEQPIRERVASYFPVLKLDNCRDYERTKILTLRTPDLSNFEFWQEYGFDRESFSEKEEEFVYDPDKIWFNGIETLSHTVL
ncbi:25441_t:CDS:1, partial [Racocetra persica]